MFSSKYEFCFPSSCSFLSLAPNFSVYLKLIPWIITTIFVFVIIKLLADLLLYFVFRSDMVDSGHRFYLKLWLWEWPNPKVCYLGGNDRHFYSMLWEKINREIYLLRALWVGGKRRQRYSQMSWFKMNRSSPFYSLLPITTTKPVNNLGGKLAWSSVFLSSTIFLWKVFLLWRTKKESMGRIWLNMGEVFIFILKIVTNHVENS